MGDDLETEASRGFWDEHSVQEPELIEPVESDDATRAPVSGPGRRLVAFVIDVLLLAVIGQVLGWSLASVWFRIGPYGRFVGLAVGLAYFGLMGSRLGGGQTLGKRLLRIAVRDSDGEPIAIGRSMLRTAAWLLPLALNGWALPILYLPVVSWVVDVVAVGVTGAVLLTVMFNRRTRQGLHDLLTSTYVVHLQGTPVESLPVAARLPWVLSAIAMVLAMAWVSVGGLFPGLGEQMGELTALRQSLAKGDSYFSVGVSDITHYTASGTARTLTIDVWYKGVPADAERSAIIAEVAKVVLAHDGIDRYDGLAIGVTSSFDLGFAQGFMRSGQRLTVAQWRGALGTVPE